MRKQNSQSVVEPFLDVFASLLFVVILALLVAMQNNSRITTELEQQVVKNKEISGELSKSIGEVKDTQNAVELQVSENARLEAELSLSLGEIRKTQNTIDMQISKNLRLAEELSKSLGSLVYVDSRTGTISIGEDSLTFALNSDEIDGNGIELLRRLARPLAEVIFSTEFKNDVYKVVVEGHTDSTKAADPNYNWQLSSKRALAVVYKLLDVSEQYRKEYERIIEATGMGDRSPIRDKWGRIDNDRSRRIEIRVVLNDKEALMKLSNKMSETISRSRQ